MRVGGVHSRDFSCPKGAVGGLAMSADRDNSAWFENQADQLRKLASASLPALIIAAAFFAYINQLIYPTFSRHSDAAHELTSCRPNTLALSQTPDQLSRLEPACCKVDGT